MINDEQIIADTFNTFFVEKIEKLKEGIDPEYIEDPLVRLTKKMVDKKHLKFHLKQVKEKQVLHTLKSLNKKKLWH